MSEGFDKAVAKLRARLEGADVEHSYRITVEDEGSILVAEGALQDTDDGRAVDASISADLDTFRALFDGEIAPAAAFMTGRLSVEGDMGAAMALGGVLG
ncbi:MAG: SCP2 sterol-binding domain-containing protein [Pseudomonadota bacterium]